MAKQRLPGPFSPPIAFTVILGALFVTEIVVMAVLDFDDPGITALVDAVILVSVVAALGHVLVLRPYRKALDDLHASQQRLRDLAEAGSDWFWETGPDHRFVWFGEHLSERSGIGPETLLGRTRWEFAQARPDDPLWRAHRADLEAGRPFRDFIYPVPDGDGRSRYFRISGRPIPGPGGRVLGYRGTGSDVTASMRREQDLLRLSRVVEQTPAAVLITDAGGCIEYANPHLTVVTGYGPDELIGRTPRLFRSGLMPAEFYDGLWAALERGDNWRGELLNRRRDGSLYWAESLIFPVRAEDGRVLNYIGISTDITERKQAEERLAAAMAELERSNAELAHFAYVASHDLQEPLRKIQAFGDRLGKELGDALPPRAADHLRRMLSAAGRMRTLIDDLLTLSRVTTAREEPAVVDLNRVVATVLSNLEMRITESGADMQIGPLPVVRANATQMVQLFQNLLANALKFRRPDAAPVVRVWAAPQRDRLLIHVADNGIGFDPAQAADIFKPFHRLHGRHDYEGTGIGLAVVARIAERHGGTITAAAAPGAGATFTLTLPVPLAKDSADEGRIAHAADRG